MAEVSGQKDRKKSKFSEFLDQNKSLKVLLPVLAVAVIFVVVLYAKPKNPAKPVSADIPKAQAGQQTQPAEAEGKSVEILPQMERSACSDASFSGISKDPFSSGSSVIVLKGITLSEGNNTAILETEDRVYVVCAGDKLGDTWNVQSIDAEGVVLTGSEGNEMMLTY